MNTTRFTAACCLLLLLAAIDIAVAGLEPSPFFNYEGVLRDASDRPLDGTFDMVFHVFDAATGGNEIIADGHSDDGVRGGLVNLQDGNGTPSDDGYLPKAFADHGRLYLEIEIEGETLAPRIEVLSTPQAFNARYVNGAEIVSTGPLDLYVDGLSGDDSSSGLSSEEPKQTIQAAIDRIPMVFVDDVTVHVAATTYAENVVIHDRSSPSAIARITLVGEPGATLAGSGSGSGVLVNTTGRVALENLIVSGFHLGVEASATELTLTSCEISGNVSHGIQAWDRVVLYLRDDVTISGNAASGVRCGRSFVALQAADVTTQPRINGNGSMGISATLACGVRFWGPAEITLNGGAGIYADNGGVANLEGRSDITVSANTACELQAGVLATVHGYANATLGGPCLCDDSSPYAVCAPTDP
jgi:hypothetical protein